MVLKFRENELDTLREEVKGAKASRQLVACQSSIVLRNAETLIYASVDDRREFAKVLGMTSVSELNRILSLYKYNKSLDKRP